MSQFLRLLREDDKATALLEVSQRLRAGANDSRVFQVHPDAFDAVPGKPFAYWVSDNIRALFNKNSSLEGRQYAAKQGLATSDDFRFVRCAWEVDGGDSKWPGFAKGGAFSVFYSPISLLVNWGKDGSEIKSEVDRKYSHIKGYQTYWVVKNPEHYLRLGLTWPRRTQRFGVRVMPPGCVFADKGPAIFCANDSPELLLALLALMSSRAFESLVELSLNAGDKTARSYEVGIIQKIPVPDIGTEERARLAVLSRRGWSLKRLLDTIEETSPAFLLPIALRVRMGEYDQRTVEAELARIQAEIDGSAFDLYGFSEKDRQSSLRQDDSMASDTADVGEDDADGDATHSAASPMDALLSWVVGIVFGRFDWRLAIGERASPAEPDPFDPVPAKSPGMLPDDAEPFHVCSGILVDDQGHPHDVARLIEEVFVRIDVSVPENVRRWLRREFFPFHLQRYSKSRRKAPIYWPLSTPSGIYTLWIYYPSLTSQTLYTAINDFVEPKLKEVGADVATLRSKGSARARDDERQFEALQAFELELIELRDTLIILARTYMPNHDDGVQISAAPLWPLFRHKPWQKVLKDTWAKLEKGDYDWAHLAMNCWPERVGEKCKTDKSLAIAHRLEDLYIEPEAKPKKARRNKKVGGDE